MYLKTITHLISLLLHLVSESLCSSALGSLALSSPARCSCVCVTKHAGVRVLLLCVCVSSAFVCCFYQLGGHVSLTCQ